MKGLIIKEPWIDLILNGEKTWEIRGSRTKLRGEIALIKSKSGKVFGTVEIADCIELDLNIYQDSYRYHCIQETTLLPYKRTYAWVLKNPKRYFEPVPYKHPQGAVIWVNL